jgi:hypothetical protein
MSGTPLWRSSAGSSIAARDPVSKVEAAIEKVVRLTLELTSANGTLVYADAVRARRELTRALSRAKVIAASLLRPSERALALYRIGEMRTIAARQLAIAPAPSPAAIETAAAGDKTLWNREARAWIASRLASGSRSGSPRRRTHRHDTHPDTPRALALARHPSRDPVPGKAGTR